MISLNRKRGTRFANNNKRGSIFDVILLLILPLILIVVFIAVYIGYTESSTALTAAATEISQGNINATEAVQSYSDVASVYDNYWDILLVLVFFGMWLGVIISAFILGNNPVFLVVYAVLSIGLFILGAYMQFAQQSLAADAGLAPYYADFPLVSFFVQYSFVIAIFFILSVGIALYLKPDSQAGFNG